MSNSYYKEKLLGLVEKLFVNEGDVSKRLIDNENLIFSVMLASQNINSEDRTKKKWLELWEELNTKKELKLGENKTISSFVMTVKSRRNKTLKKYLHFILEEYFKQFNY